MSCLDAGFSGPSSWPIPSFQVPPACPRLRTTLEPSIPENEAFPNFLLPCNCTAKKQQTSFPTANDNFDPLILERDYRMMASSCPLSGAVSCRFPMADKNLVLDLDVPVSAALRPSESKEAKAVEDVESDAGKDAKSSDLELSPIPGLVLTGLPDDDFCLGAGADYSSDAQSFGSVTKIDDDFFSPRSRAGTWGSFKEAAGQCEHMFGASPTLTRACQECAQE